MTIDEAADRLRAEGLIVKTGLQDDSLRVCSTTYKAGDLEFTQNLSILHSRDGIWRVGYPSFPITNAYEITGELDYLCDLIVEAYREHKKMGTFLGFAWEAVRHNHGMQPSWMTNEPALAG